MEQQDNWRFGMEQRACVRACARARRVCVCVCVCVCLAKAVRHLQYVYRLRLQSQVRKPVALGAGKFITEQAS